MVRPVTYTSLILMAALVTGCAGGSDGNDSGRGPAPGAVDPSSDDDGDGVIAAKDRCPELSTSKWVDQAGCSESQDGDADGLPTDQDLCPGTPAGEPVDGNGCSDSQKSGAAAPGEEASSAEYAAAAKDWTEAKDGAVADNGFATFVLDPKGKVPAVLRTLAKNVKKLESGFELSGSVMIEVPGNQSVTLAEGKLMLKYDSAKGEGLQSFEGTARLPFPNLGFMSGVELGDLVYCSVGWELGKDIENVDAPLKDDRKYFYFTFSAGLDAKIGSLSVSTAVNQSATMTLDPTDPAFFLRASLGGLMGPVDEASVGFSIGGHLPFTPENTWGLDAQKASFDGHMWLGGKLNLNFAKIPLAIGGNTVVDFDPNDDGKTLFQGATDGVNYGSNSQVDVSIDAKLLAFEIPVAQATTVAHVGQDGAWAMYSGKITAGNAWIAQLPIKNSAELKVAGLASSKLEESYFKAQGDMSLDAGKLGEWTGLDLDDLAMATASLDIDENGVLIKGKATTSISPLVGLSGSLDAVGYFNGDPNGWYVTLDGRLAVKSIDLGADAHLLLDKNGMFVSGKMTTPISLIEMSGSITKSGVDLTGHAEVEIPIVAGKELVQWVTDAAVCGYETVTDAAVCGYQTVKDGALCGTKVVTDAALCGTKTVTDAAVCGSQYVTSGAICGYKTVTSATQCGVDYFSDAAHCGWDCVSSLFKSCSCSFPKTCQVATSCWTAKTCTVAATCNIANTCSVPASCQKVKTCEKKVIVPDFDYGTFKGQVTVKIGNGGLHGDASGQYCATGGSCTTIASGSVKMTSAGPEACVNVAGLGEFCGKI
ncbi:MAG: hypothetical protein AMXMBFR56_46250 [Polyangiaceae bacterium]